MSRSAAYVAIPSSSCVDGTWTPTNASTVTGIVYVPCAVNLTKAGRYDATIAAEGLITVTARGITVGPGSAQRGAVALAG